jgi:hypothetical protein
MRRSTLPGIVAAGVDRAYHRETGEIVAFVWGKRDLKTANGLKKKLSDSGVSYGGIASEYFGERHHRGEAQLPANLANSTYSCCMGNPITL